MSGLTLDALYPRALPVVGIGTSPYRPLNFADKLSGIAFVTHLETVVARARTQLCNHELPEESRSDLVEYLKTL